MGYFGSDTNWLKESQSRGNSKDSKVDRVFNYEKELSNETLLWIYGGILYLMDPYSAPEEPRQHVRRTINHSTWKNLKQRLYVKIN